jgi:hypothetical protein
MLSTKISQASSSVLDVHNANGELDVLIVQSAPVDTSKSASSSAPSAESSPNQGIFQNVKRDLHINNHTDGATRIYQADNIEQVANFQPTEMINDRSHPQASKKSSQEIIELPPSRGDLLSSTLNRLHRVCFRCLGADHFIKDCTSAFRCLYCYNYGHRYKYCVKRRLELRRKWAPKPSKLPLEKKSLASNDEMTVPSNAVIEWALNPNAPNDPSVLNIVQGSLTCCISQLHSSPPFNPVHDSEFAALPSVIADSQHFHMGEEQSTEIIAGAHQHVEEQNVILQNGHHKIGSQGNNLQMVCASQAVVPAMAQQEGITNFLLDGLRQMVSNQINIQGSRLLGSLTILGSVIHIDLAALGITSLGITMPTLVLDSTSGVGSVNNNTPDMRKDRRQIIATFTRTPPITKVYYRKNPKGRTEKKNDQLKQKRTPILYEPAEDYTIVDDHLDAQENSGTTSSQANDNLEPIVIDRAILQTYLTPTLAITGLEIVPWKPVLSALALQLWPAILASRKATRVQPSTSTVIILPSPRVEQVPATFKPSGFKFQSEKMQPSLLSLPEASSNLIMPLVESSVKRNTRICTSMSLPDAPSNSATPLVDNSVRRSTRLSAKDGFHEVRLAGNPSKKRKTRPVLLVEPMGQTRPIPIEILQGWGIDCGVAPGELSQEALMQAPSSDPLANDEASI